MITVQEILDLAQSQIGIKESSVNSNNVKYNTIYYQREVNDKSYAWCVVFLWWLFRELGAGRMFYDGKKTASCTTLYSYHRNLSQAVADYQPGDLIFFNFYGGSSMQHVGICESVDSTSITTIDGNTGTTSEANGGAVMRRNRSKRYIVGGFRPVYQSVSEGADDMTKDEVLAILKEYETAKTAEEAAKAPDSWSAEARTWAEEEGILTGDETGAKQYKAPCTREMMVVMLYRLWVKVKGYIDEKLKS